MTHHTPHQHTTPTEPNKSNIQPHILKPTLHICRTRITAPLQLHINAIQTYNLRYRAAQHTTLYQHATTRF
ncbi:hypothetical protein E2C01_045953 [Portunus trituberculatus]|uniref:Uncharacterized protein n=1 Tax=Portunus trituberculatus TaxID=210409 RepID=A0A5B7G4B3_PORTR|nr:hypothetical protein [Portunus trituberculatus]